MIQHEVCSSDVYYTQSLITKETFYLESYLTNSESLNRCFTLIFHKSLQCIWKNIHAWPGKAFP